MINEKTARRWLQRNKWKLAAQGLTKKNRKQLRVVAKALNLKIKNADKT